MTSASSSTSSPDSVNADRALAYLQTRPNEWIAVTSDETVEALRELRQSGHRVIQRVENDGSRSAKYMPPEPDLAALAEKIFDPVSVELVDAGCLHPTASRDISSDGRPVCRACGEILVVNMSTPGTAGRHMAMERREVDGKVVYEVSYETCAQCGEQYAVRDDHVRMSQRHSQWSRGELGPEVPVPIQQPRYKFPVDWPKERIEFGLIVTCPRCHGRTRGQRVNHRSGKIAPAEDWTRDPSKTDERCHSCNGWGIVPNQGAVPTNAET